MRNRAAEILAEGKREELIREDILARSPRGVLVTANALHVGDDPVALFRIV